MDPIQFDFFREVPLFADMADDDLARLCEVVGEVRLSAGQELFAEGSHGDYTYFVGSGELEVIKDSGGRRVLLAVRGTGDVIGEVALLEDAPRDATVQARSDSMLYAIHREQFEHLLSTSPTASHVLATTVLARWRAASAALRQSEKMAQLGTLTAGVAHELNNPAAAVKRGAGQLDEVVAAYAEAQSLIARLDLDSDQVSALDQLMRGSREAGARPSAQLDALSRSDLEHELETWLVECAVPEAWELAPTLVDLGYDLASLEASAEQFAPDQLPAVVRWLTTSYTVHNLLAEIGQGATRISEIVRALKSYVYLDRAPIQEIDVHEGIDNTLLILRHKLAKVKVRREYAPALPPIQAYGSELNQVWTNLIDNAADAVQDTTDGEVVIRTMREGDWITVEVEDNGPGIPPEIKPRLFDPFFTTKAPGMGTGLGLEISYNIVVNNHRGDIEVRSRRGRTIFQVSLPVDFEAADAASKPIAAAQGNGDALLKRVLEDSRSIAVVGISARPERPAHTVPAYLEANGYNVIPVNPNLDEVLGKKVYPDLLSVPEPVDVVEIFRRGEAAVPIVEQAIQIGAKAVWMQEGIMNEQAAELARQAGLDVVMDACMRSTHWRLCRDGSP